MALLINKPAFKNLLFNIYITLTHSTSSTIRTCATRSDQLAVRDSHSIEIVNFDSTYNISFDNYHKHSKTMASEMQQVWKRADCVCFDVDSTVITEEGIDELAKFCNKGTEVSNLTSKAMSGSMMFQESLQLRLDIIQPSFAQLHDFIRSKPPKLSPGIKKLVDALQVRNIPIYLISGGFKSIISPIAQQLNIPQENIYANKLKFYFTGEYAGFDSEQPTSKSGGKAVVIKLLKSQYGFKNLILIGDGATDLEACPPADAFIGYGGNVVREIVRSKAKWYVTDFNELIKVLKE